MEPSDRREWVRGLALLAWISWEVLGWSAIGVGMGYLGHRMLGTPEWAMVLTGAMGLAVAFWRIYKASQQLGSPE